MRSNYKSTKRDAPGTSNERESKAGQSKLDWKDTGGKEERGGEEGRSKTGGRGRERIRFA